MANDQKNPESTPTHRKPKGRPKGAGPTLGRLNIACSNDYQTWLKDFAEHYSVIAGSRKTVADVIRDCLRVQAESRGFRKPPLM